MHTYLYLCILKTHTPLIMYIVVLNYCHAMIPYKSINYGQPTLNICGPMTNNENVYIIVKQCYTYSMHGRGLM